MAVTRWRSFWGTVLQTKSSRVRFPMVSLEFFIDIILRAALWPWVDLASNRNEYQEYFLRGKGGLCLGLATLISSCAASLEIWKPHGLSRVVQGLLYLYFFSTRLLEHLTFSFITNIMSTANFSFLPHAFTRLIIRPYYLGL